MSLFDRAVDKAPERFRRFLLLADAVSRLGAGWVLFRLRYRIEMKFGFIERRMPVSPWPALQVGDETMPAIVDARVLGAWLRHHADTERIAELQNRLRSLAERRFDVFGHSSEPDGWHHDAVDDVRYASGDHWSNVAVPEGADVKFIWEPSRFGWAFDLARLHQIDPGAGACDLFWELFDEWCEQNPPNAGVNWSCGQEASIRLMAAVVAASAMRDCATPERAAKLRRLAMVTADRVRGNIAYARSQKNNHHASEAVGLLTASLLFPELPGSKNWLKIGERHLREVCEELVFADGGTSQYSTNYHRVFVHNFVWAVALYRSAGKMPPTWLSETCLRTTDFLDAIAEPISGSGPFYGHDDGARILPLSNTGHRNLAEDIALARAMRQGLPTDSSPLSEGAAWFGLADADPAKAVEINAQRPFLWVFPESGVHVMGSGATRAYVRAGSYRFRPAQDDALHCDVWVDGANVFVDSGTASYGPLREGAGMLDTGVDHNGPRRPDHEMMKRASRFLWARWSASRVDETEISDHVAQARFSVQDGENRIHRTVKVAAGRVEIIDSHSGDSPLQSIWKRGADETALLAAIEVDAGEVCERPQFVSTAYGSAKTTLATVVASEYACSRPLRTMVHATGLPGPQFRED